MVSNGRGEESSILHSVHLHEMSGLEATYPPITGPSTGPVNAALANTGNASTRSIGLHRSDIEPPAHVSGVDPKKPAKKRNASCAPIFGASPDAMMKIIYSVSVEM